MKLENTSYRFLALCIAALWLLGFAVAMWAPESVLTDSSIARTLQIVGALQNKMAGSSFPEVSALYFSIVWWAFPFLFLACWKWMNSEVGHAKSGLLFKSRLSFWNRLGLLLITPIWLFLAYVGFSLNDGGNTRFLFLGASRLHLALFGMTIPLGVAAMLALTCFSVKRSMSFNSEEKE